MRSVAETHDASGPQAIRGALGVYHAPRENRAFALKQDLARACQRTIRTDMTMLTRYDHRVMSNHQPRTPSFGSEARPLVVADVDSAPDPLSVLIGPGAPAGPTTPGGVAISAAVDDQLPPRASTGVEAVALGHQRRCCFTSPPPAILEESLRTCLRRLHLGTAAVMSVLLADGTLPPVRFS